MDEIGESTERQPDTEEASGRHVTRGSPIQGPVPTLQCPTPSRTKSFYFVVGTVNVWWVLPLCGGYCQSLCSGFPVVYFETRSWGLCVRQTMYTPLLLLRMDDHSMWNTLLRLRSTVSEPSSAFHWLAPGDCSPLPPSQGREETSQCHLVCISKSPAVEARRTQKPERCERRSFMLEEQPLLSLCKMPRGPAPPFTMSTSFLHRNLSYIWSRDERTRSWPI